MIVWLAVHIVIIHTHNVTNCIQFCFMHFQTLTYCAINPKLHCKTYRVVGPVACGRTETVYWVLTWFKTHEIRYTVIYMVTCNFVSLKPSNSQPYK